MSCSMSIDAVGLGRMIWICRFYVHIIHDDVSARYCLAAAEVDGSILADGCAMESIISHITHFDCRFLYINSELVDNKGSGLLASMKVICEKLIFLANPDPPYTRTENHRGSYH